MLLKGKKGIVLGVANDKSIAWGISSLAAEQGAELAFTYQNEILEKRVRPLAASVNSDLIYECDVNNDETLDKLANDITKKWGYVDFIIHSVAFADKDELKGKYLNTSRKNFNVALETSCYSLTAVMSKFEDLLAKAPNGSSVVTLSYYGAEKVIPNYNVMGVAKAALEASVRYLASDVGYQGIRVNTISSGPIKTLAASGIGDFRSVLKWNESVAPMRKNVTTEDVAGMGVFLISDLAKSVTGQVLYVDSGYSVVGMPGLEVSSKLAASGE